MTITPTPELSILMPVRNEAINLRIMLKLLKAVVEVPHEVVVVYDTEDDDTLSLKEDAALDLSRTRFIRNYNRGVVHALKTGVAHCRGKYVLLFAADEVGPVLAVDDMLALMHKGCDLVSCTRYSDGGRRLGGSLIGGILSRVANKLFGWISGAQLSDCTTGIKIFRREVFDQLELTSKPVGWAVAFEMAIKAQLMGLQLGEVPIISIDRLYGGQSTFRVGPWVVEYLRWFFWGAWMLRKSSTINPNLLVIHTPAVPGMGGRGPQ